MVRGEHHLGLLSVAVERLGDVLRPVQRIADRRATQRVDVVQRRGDVLGHPERLHRGDVGVHLRGRFGVRRVLEDHLDAVDLELLDVLLDDLRRRDQPHAAGRHALAEALADVAIRARRQQQAVLVEQPPVHRVAGIHVLGDRVLHEVARRDDGNLSCAHIRFIDDAAHAAPVVAVRVRVDHRRDRKALADVLLEQLQRRASRFRRRQRIDDDPAALAADERDVGEIEAADLVDARDHLVQPIVHVEHGNAVQGRVDAVESLAPVQELEPLHVPGDVAVVGHDLGILGRRDEAFLLLLEVPLVGERQRGPRLPEHFLREARWRLALRIEVPAWLSRVGGGDDAGRDCDGQRHPQSPGESHGKLLECWQQSCPELRRSWY